ncbi:hypothetical protein [Nocardia pseudovaccinii]|uniref:hypothetical protein n=1 Tax=Nocardia pseudovaccinii TaxID=189540 RepID=UPI0007A47EF1|nr:hypothetical protein [Nocardia pseudovaccinii]
MFTPEEVEALVCTAAQLWASTGDLHDILSTYQKDLLVRAHALLTDDDHDGTAASDSPETAFAIAHHDPAPFALDEPAFGRWIAAEGDQIAGNIASSHDEEPASDLVALVDAAHNAGVLTGDPRLELLIDHDNAPRHPGFTLLLRNHCGEQENVAVTTGFTELTYIDPALSTAAAARWHLEHVITVANSLLHQITGQPPTPRGEGRGRPGMDG